MEEWFENSVDLDRRRTEKKEEERKDMDRICCFRCDRFKPGEMIGECICENNRSQLTKSSVQLPDVENEH